MITEKGLLHYAKNIIHGKGRTLTTPQGRKEQLERYLKEHADRLDQATLDTILNEAGRKGGELSHQWRTALLEQMQEYYGAPPTPTDPAVLNLLQQDVTEKRLEMITREQPSYGNILIYRELLSNNEEEGTRAALHERIKHEQSDLEFISHIERMNNEESRIKLYGHTLHVRTQGTSEDRREHEKALLALKREVEDPTGEQNITEGMPYGHDTTLTITYNHEQNTIQEANITITTNKPAWALEQAIRFKNAYDKGEEPAKTSKYADFFLNFARNINREHANGSLTYTINSQGASNPVNDVFNSSRTARQYADDVAKATPHKRR